MNEILERLKSPVVIIQLVSIIAGLIVFFSPQSSDAVKAVTTAAISAINILAGLNNPADKENF